MQIKCFTFDCISWSSSVFSAFPNFSAICCLYFSNIFGFEYSFLCINEAIMSNGLYKLKSTEAKKGKMNQYNWALVPSNSNMTCHNFSYPLLQIFILFLFGTSWIVPSTFIETFEEKVRKLSLSFLYAQIVFNYYI